MQIGRMTNREFLQVVISLVESDHVMTLAHCSLMSPGVPGPAMHRLETLFGAFHVVGLEAHSLLIAASCLHP